ncbi:hypothetical protein C8E86_5493 [Catellatospora citrea]|nr:hypothetical protein C8E86_5493 [Catellatospora citrea]
MILVGNKWPTGDETALRAEAAVWREAAQTVRSCSEQVVLVKRLVDGGSEGGTRRAFDDYVTGLVGAGPQDESAILPVLAACCDSAADSLEELANEIETLRVTIIGCLVVLWVQLMIDVAMWLFGGAAKAAADIAVTRTLLLQVLRRAISIAVTRVAESILAQVGFTLLAQLIQLAEGHRRSLDGTQLRTAAINGAVGGAVGVGAGFLGGVLRSGAGKLANTGFGKILTSGASQLPGNRRILPAAGRTTANLAWGAGYGALAGMAEGAAQDAVFGLSGDWISGAANGAFNGAWGVRHSAMNPGNKLSISPADHLEASLDRYLDRPARPLPPAALDSAEREGDASWSSTPDDAEGHEVWRDEPSSNDSHTLIRPPDGVPLPPAEPNPWLDPNTDPPHQPPQSGHLSPDLEGSPWTDESITIPARNPPTTPPRWIDPWAQT